MGQFLVPPFPPAFLTATCMILFPQTNRMYYYFPRFLSCSFQGVFECPAFGFGPVPTVSVAYILGVVRNTKS
jgi:hypothetical protein